MRHASDVASSTIHLTETSTSTVVHLAGEVDGALRDQASTALARALDRDLPVVLDTGGVTFIDSMGIAFLIQFCTIGREEGLQVTLQDPPTIVSEVLDLLGLGHVFDEPGAEVSPAPADPLDLLGALDEVRTDDALVVSDAG